MEKRTLKETIELIKKVRKQKEKERKAKKKGGWEK